MIHALRMARSPKLPQLAALFVAIAGSPATLGAGVTAYHRGWLIMAAITLLGLIPTFYLIRNTRPRPVAVEEK